MKQKNEISDLEKQKRKIICKKIIRNLLTIPEIIIVIIVIIFLKNKYVEHSKNVHQIIEYESTPYSYTMERINDNIEVRKINEDKIVEASYEIKFSKNQMTILKGYFDATFKLKSTSKKVTMDQVISDVGKKSIRSMIHNDEDFLKTSTYKKYELEDYEQNSDYNERGYTIINKNNKKHLIISLGMQESSGYLITVSEAHKKDDTIVFYITTTEPSVKNNNTTFPMLMLQLEDNIDKVKVFELDTGEELSKYEYTQNTNNI